MTPILATRTMSGGSWGEWEYINAPLVSGKEYRTTARWNGHPVYVTYVARTFSGKQGSTSSNTDIKFEHGISGLVNLVKLDATINARYLMPYTDTSTGGNVNIIDVTTSNIVVRLYKTYWDSPTFNVILYYTKG